MHKVDEGVAARALARDFSEGTREEHLPYLPRRDLDPRNRAKGVKPAAMHRRRYDAKSSELMERPSDVRTEQRRKEEEEEAYAFARARVRVHQGRWLRRPSAVHSVTFIRDTL